MKTGKVLAILAVLAIAGPSGGVGAQILSPGEALKRARVKTPAPAPPPSRSPDAASPVQSANPAGITDPMHLAHLGQVVFTRTELDRNQMSEAALVNNFNLGDPIFFRVYMREPTAAHLAPQLPGKTPYWVSRATRYKAIFTVGGQVVETHFRIWGKAGDHETWTTWRGELLSRADKFQPGTEVFREFLSRATQRGLMGIGTHKIKLEIVPYAINLDGDVDHTGVSKDPPAAIGNVIATGELTLTVKPGAYAKSDPKICTPAFAPSNPALEQKILSQARSQWNRPEAPPVRVRLTYGGWNFNRHPISGRVIDRNIDTIIMSRGKNYCDFQAYSYVEPNVGGFSTANASFVSEPFNWFMPCSCLD